MARKPETTERFKVSFEARSDSFGQILIALERFGVHNIGYEIITDVPTYHKNNSENDKPRTRTAQKYTALFLKSIQDSGTLSFTELTKIASENGLAPTSVNHFLNQLLDNGTIKRAKRGRYTLSDETPPTKHKSRKEGALPFIIALLAKKGAMAPGNIGQELMKGGFSAATVNSALARLRKTLKVTRKENGLYTLVEPPAYTNGPAVSPLE